MPCCSPWCDLTGACCMCYERVYRFNHLCHQPTTPPLSPSVPCVLVASVASAACCRVRMLHWWGNFYKPGAPETRDPRWSRLNLDLRQILTPYPDHHTTFVGFFVHSLVTLRRPKRSSRPKKVCSGSAREEGMGHGEAGPSPCPKALALSCVAHATPCPPPSLISDRIPPSTRETSCLALAIVPAFPRPTPRRLHHSVGGTGRCAHLWAINSDETGAGDGCGT